ncbi:ArsR family transcriptional regulator [Streptomyces sp. NPDC001728]|uniref:AAA family ATPase n=1 Tax=Streptomyces sp. NPDC001728 TaxID=3154396 RepID=UPI0033175B57
MGALVTPVARPQGLYDREAEWDRLVAFVGDPRPGPAIGVVTGPRGHGKSFLLKALTRATGGFYFSCQEAAQAETLRALAQRYARHAGLARAPHWTGWRDALLALAVTGHGPTALVVIDGFPEVVRQSPGLPATINEVCHQLGDGQGGSSRLRLLLCGSTTPVMTRLLSGADRWVDQVVEVAPLDFRRARDLWAIEDLALALRVHAVVGGSAAFRFDPAGDRPPTGFADFDRWIQERVLSPRLPLFWKAGHILDRVPDSWDVAVCHSTVAALAAGRSTPGEIADFLDRPATDVPHILSHLEERGLVRGEPDAFQPGLIHYRITEPLLAFDHAVIRPHRPELVDADVTEIDEIWRQARAVFERDVAGPYFARICREWAVLYAPAELFGEAPESAVSGSLPHTTGEPVIIDVVVRGEQGRRPGPLLSIGLVSWTHPMDTPHLERLRGHLTRLAALGEDTGRTRLVCYSAAGFSPGLRAAEENGDVLLVSPEQLYGDGPWPYTAEEGGRP